MSLRDGWETRTPDRALDRIRELGWLGARGNADQQLVDTFGGLDARMVVYGHLHRPFMRRIGGLTVANTGSVGWPVDGDWRPSYLLIDDDHVQIRRVSYDLAAQIAELRASTHPLRSWLIKVHQRAESVRPLELDTTFGAEPPPDWGAGGGRDRG